MQLSNGVELLYPSPDNQDYQEFPATASDTWKQGDFLYWDTVNSVVKKYAPADATEAESLQPYIFGIATNAKLANETKAIVNKKCQVLMDATNPLLGAECVVVYNTTTLKYTAYEGTQYNTDYDPDITLTLNFLTFTTAAVESDNRAVMQIDGNARLLSFN
jgi:hypothetical protein